MIRLFLLSIHLSFPSLYFLHESLNQPLNQPTQIKTQPNPSHLTTPSTSHPLPPKNAIHILHALPIPYKANHEPGARSHEQKEIKTDIYLIYLSIHLSIHVSATVCYLHIYLRIHINIHIYIYLSIHIARFNSLHFTSLHFNSIQSNPLQPTSLQPNPTQSTPLPSTLPYTTLQYTHHTTPPFSPNLAIPQLVFPAPSGDEIGISFSLLFSSLGVEWSGVEWVGWMGWMDGWMGWMGDEVGWMDGMDGWVGWKERKR